MRLRGIDKPGHRLTGVLISLGSHLAEVMHPAVDVAVFMQIVIALALNHTKRFLRRRGVVEIHQLLAVDQLVEHRELLPNIVYIEMIQNRKF